MLEARESLRRTQEMSVAFGAKNGRQVHRSWQREASGFGAHQRRGAQASPLQTQAALRAAGIQVEVVKK